MIFIHKVDNFKNHKSKIIDLINKTPSNSLNETDAQIIDSDWNLSDNNSKYYFPYLKENILNNFFKDFLKNKKFKNIEVNKIWFQVYSKDDYHGLHTHPHCHFTNIIYVNLPNQNTQTKVYDFNGSIINLELNEGDILTIPAFFKHESPKNNFYDKKIIISFNTNIY